MPSSTTRSTTRVTGAAALAALALTVSACGGSNDDSKAAKNLSASIMQSQKGSSTSQFLDLKKKDADCIGKGLVDKVGTDDLKKYGVLDKNLKPSKTGISDVKMSADDAKSTTGVLFGCADVEKMMQGAINKSGQIPKTMQSCVNKALSEDHLRPMFTQLFQGRTDAAQKALTGPMTKCATGSAG
jgi:hypothetical protein